MRSGGVEPDPAVPPWPVFGAPRGITGVVVVVVGEDVVVVVGVVVVVVGDDVVVVDVVVVDVVVVGATAAQVGTVMVLPSRVIAPVWTRTRPLTWAPVFRVADVNARIVPLNDVVVPNVAEEPTCQKTLHDWAPPARATELPVAVVSVDPL